jgi:hypothetical protein
MKRLLSLYPAWWRRRYEAEMRVLIEDLRAEPRRMRLAMILDLLRGAVDARLAKEFRMPSNFGRALRRGLLIGLAVWALVSVEIVLSNVVFPSRVDNDGPAVAIGYFVIFTSLALVGVFAERTRTSLLGVTLVGALAGALIGALTMGTFAVVDNAFLDIVSRQQTKIDGFARSGASSMRDYINASLAATALGMTLFLAGIGAVLAGGAGLLARRQVSPSQAPER